MDKKRKIITCAVIILAAGLFCAGIVSAAACYLTAKVLDKEPSINSVENTIPSEKATLSATAKVQELFMAIMNPSPEKEKTLCLSSDEINAIITMARTFQQFSGDQESAEKVFVAFKDSKFTIAFSQKLEFSTPFGSYINMRIVIIPDYSEKSKEIKVDSLKIGEITLSSSTIGEMQLGRFLDLFFGLSGSDAKFTETVKSISIDKAGNLVVVYNPSKLQVLLKDKLNEKITEIQIPPQQPSEK